ncbi:MAG: hypothetical protein WAX69_07390 [Victivallales bacterium]
MKKIKTVRLSLNKEEIKCLRSDIYDSYIRTGATKPSVEILEILSKLSRLCNETKNITNAEFEKMINQHIEEELSRGVIIKKHLTKEEQKRLKRPAVIKQRIETREEYIESCKSVKPTDSNSIISVMKMIEEDCLLYINQKTATFSVKCLKMFLKYGRYPNLIDKAYLLGQEVMLGRLWEHLYKPPGAPTAATYPIYWGKKFNDYRIGHEAYRKNPRSKKAAWHAQEQVAKDWKKESPLDPETGETLSKPCEDTFLKYEKAYLETLKQKE